MVAFQGSRQSRSLISQGYEASTQRQESLLPLLFSNADNLSLPFESISRNMKTMIIFALVIATFVPAAVLYFMYRRDFYGTGSFTTVIQCFAWGLVAFGLALGTSKIVFGFDLLTQNQWVQFGAPIIEEILKALILIYLVRRPKFTYFVDGAIYGFAAGIGFAVIENWSYIFDYGASVAIGRVISTNLVHATASALVGIALGYSRFQKFSGRILLLLGGWLVGMSLHIGFNNLVTRVSSGFLVLYAAGVGITGASFIVLMIRRGYNEQKQWIKESLGERDRVTAGEAAVVNRLTDVETLLAPIAEQFGPDKAKQCEHFLFLQARLGIKRKTLDKLTDEKMKQGVQAEIDELRTEIDDARRSVGSYTMVLLRSIFPEDDSPLWARLEHAIQEQITTRGSRGGTSVWDTLGDRASHAAGSAGQDG